PQAAAEEVVGAVEEPEARAAAAALGGAERPADLRVGVAGGAEERRREALHGALRDLLQVAHRVVDAGAGLSGRERLRAVAAVEGTRGRRLVQAQEQDIAGL